MRNKTGTEPAALALAALDAEAVLAFLDHLERDRGCTVRSRNNRLAAIRSFFRLVALYVPDALGQVTRIMAIPVKRGDKRLVSYLTRNEVKALLAAPDRATWSGRRDHALLLTLYNSGARVSEIIALRRAQVRLDPAGPCLELHGKGRKQRVVPLWTETARVLRAWLRELDGQAGAIDSVAFPSARGRHTLPFCSPPWTAWHFWTPWDVALPPTAPWPSTGKHDSSEAGQQATFTRQQTKCPTHPDARGKGVGRALTEAVYDHARAAGCTRVYWQTHETNHTAMRLYD